MLAFLRGDLPPEEMRAALQAAEARRSLIEALYDVKKVRETLNSKP